LYLPDCWLEWEVWSAYAPDWIGIVNYMEEKTGSQSEFLPRTHLLGALLNESLILPETSCQWENAASIARKVHVKSSNTKL